jgi:hypothetical protein
LQLDQLLEQGLDIGQVLLHGVHMLLHHLLALHPTLISWRCTLISERFMSFYFMGVDICSGWPCPIGISAWGTCAVGMPTTSSAIPPIGMLNISVATHIGTK